MGSTRDLRGFGSHYKIQLEESVNEMLLSRKSAHKLLRLVDLPLQSPQLLAAIKGETLNYADSTCRRFT